MRFSNKDYAEIEQMATDAQTTRPRVVSRLVAYAIRTEQLGFREQQDKMDQIARERERLINRVTLLEQQLQDRENELRFLRQEYTKMNDALLKTINDRLR
ncbi:MAG: hypothetical protein LUP95_07110 [Euryarchaeota archaeon]|nr:hypothetical protein [Euryarchaeota archaeon]